MKALQFRKSVPRYLLQKLLAKRFRRLSAGPLAPVALREVQELSLPTQQWVGVAPRLAGICGSDLATLCATGSPYLAPITSMPFVLGHELVGIVSDVGDEVDGVAVGDRVVIRPALGCKPRGIAPMCAACASGRDALCSNVARGDIAAGIQTGFCRDTGGGFGDRLVAHHSQVFRIPLEVKDTEAVLIEPFACALHGALQAPIQPDDRVLIIGGGAIGLLTVAALRAIDCKAHIVVVAKHEHQREHAVRLGADEVIGVSSGVAQRYADWARVFGADVLKPEIGKPAVIGGADVTIDCVASSESIDDGLRFTRSGGSFVLVGMPGFPKNVDWTSMWFKELIVRASYAYGPHEDASGVVRDTFAMAVKMMGNWGARLSPLAGQPFSLEEHRAAFASALFTGQSRVVKTLFAVGNQ